MSLAEVLALEIRRQLLNRPKRSAKPNLLPPKRDPLPPAERVRRVPKLYHDLLGDHADHPGEGRGAHALRRAKERGLTSESAQQTLMLGTVDL
jgi:DNA (cytosine-5)-methyltransferase 1